MNSENNVKEFNQCVEPLDWRYSAAIVGLYKYFQYIGEEDIDYRVTDDTFEFNEEGITEDKYFEFVRYFCKQNMINLPSSVAESILLNQKITTPQKNLINRLLNKIPNNDIILEDNVEEVLSIIKENEIELIKKEFFGKFGKYRYDLFINSNKLFDDKDKVCRIKGYYVDKGRKIKSISYNFDAKTLVYHNYKYFDFIPFAFVGNTKFLFINDSYSVMELIKSNINFEYYFNNIKHSAKDKRVDVDGILLESICKITDFLDYDVEIISKDNGDSCFETMFLRKDSINVIKKIKDLNIFNKRIKINGDEQYIQKYVINSIINLVRTDSLIELLFKEKSTYLISKLIELNILICKGGERMNESMKQAYGCAKKVINKLPANKVNSYRQKLINSVIFKDYDQCCQILLQMSNYSNTPFNFAFDLFENFEENKDIIYTFINALTDSKSDEKEAN